MKLTHIDNQGSARMVDISGKHPVRRTAKASATIHMRPETLELIYEGLMKKGDVLATARIAGITGAKKTVDLIPLCHQVQIDSVDIEFKMLKDGIYILAHTVCTDKTGIEMEALTGAAIAALTIYDMCKAVDREMVIEEIRLLEKTKLESPCLN